MAMAMDCRTLIDISETVARGERLLREEKKCLTGLKEIFWNSLFQKISDKIPKYTTVQPGTTELHGALSSKKIKFYIGDARFFTYNSFKPYISRQNRLLEIAVVRNEANAKDPCRLPDYNEFALLYIERDALKLKTLTRGETSEFLFPAEASSPTTIANTLAKFILGQFPKD